MAQIVTIAIEETAIKLMVVDGDQIKTAVSLPLESAMVEDGVVSDRVGVSQKIRELIASEIKKVNHFLPEGSKVKRFINLPKELDADEGELTRTRKIRRKFLEEKYNEFILHIYEGDKEFKAKIPVKYRDGRSGVVNATVFANDLIEGD